MSKTWRERIAEARERGDFTAQDRRDAFHWCSCAVNEQHLSMPSVIIMAGDTIAGLGPQDAGLANLGTRFNLAVARNRFDDAEALLDAIEDRALQLKREQAS